MDIYDKNHRVKCGSYWGFTVHEKVFAVPFSTCAGDVVPWTIGKNLNPFPTRIMNAAADWQVEAQGALISDRLNSTILSQGVYSRDFICTQKSDLLSTIHSSVFEVITELFTSECISFRDSGQYGFGQHFLGRS